MINVGDLEGIAFEGQSLLTTPTATTTTSTTLETTSLIQEDEVTKNIELTPIESQTIDWLEILSGEVVTNTNGLIEGIDGFSTVCVKNCKLGPTSQLTNQSLNSRNPSHSQYYYEVELITGGLFQV